MCGICGIVSRDERNLGSLVRAMNDAQAHRGPDGEGFCIAADPLAPRPGYDASLEQPSRCAMGHRRLAIIDPEGGAQPMVSADGKLAILFNGEIYNFLELRRRLEANGSVFRTASDTEVLLHLYRESPDEPGAWLAQLNGIFAIALWDQERKRLLLARDHYGVKPLHYAVRGETVYFASEIKSILAAGVEPVLSLKSLHAFLNVRYVPTNETLFKDIHRLPPAHFAIVQNGVVERVFPFYALRERCGTPTEASCDELHEEIRRRFYEAVRRQLLSDVPVGMSLSGGLDSSMIVAAAVEAYGADSIDRHVDSRARTFTLGFNEPTDEIEDAQTVADRFGTEHHEIYLSADPLVRMREVIRAVEEPKINILQGYLLSEFIRREVKVYLGGLGGDELFAGYDIHRFCNTLGRLHALTPAFVQQGLWGPLSRGLWRLQRRSGARRNDYLRIGAQIALSAGDRAQFYSRLRNAWDADDGMYDWIYAQPGTFRRLPPTVDAFTRFFDTGEPFLDQVLHAEFHTKMVNDFLVNEDRVSSAHGLEGRVPFLDRDLVELAFTIPAAKKIRGTETKRLWKQSVAHILPPRIIVKKKQGFTFSSYHQWTKDLRATVERELTREWCSETGLFNHGFVRDILDYPAHPHLRWHYFMVWMMVGIKEWMSIFNVGRAE